MNKLFILSSILALFFIGCGKSKSEGLSEELIELMSCGKNLTDQQERKGSSALSKLSEEQLNKVLNCMKPKVKEYCTLANKGDKASVGAAGAIVVGCFLAAGIA